MPSVGWKSLGWAAVAVAGAAVAKKMLVRPLRWNGRVVAITGGSRGLGLVLARKLALRGARLALCARSEPELLRAEEELRGLGAEVMTVACDVGDAQQAAAAMGRIEARFGRVDVLINAAGIIHVAPAAEMGLADYRAAMATNFWGVVHTSLAVLPGMRARREGRIVNITSIGGAVPVPHLLPYSASKFAAVGFSQGLGAEEAANGIRVTTVLPGLMRTGSFVQALFKSDREAEAAWFSATSSVPGLSLQAERAAGRILRSCARGDAFVTLGLPAKVLRLGHALAPGLARAALSAAHGMLPAASGAGPASVPEPGFLQKAVLAPGWPLAQAREAAQENRELPWAPPLHH